MVEFAPFLNCWIQKKNTQLIKKSSGKKPLFARKRSFLFDFDEDTSEGKAKEQER